MAKKLNIGDEIPDEIIAEILPRLPVKSLCRFKCVSKPWLALISSERFANNHLLSYSHKFPRILVYHSYPNYQLVHCSLNSLLDKSDSEDEYEVMNIYYPGKQIIRDGSVIGSCNGLLCLSIGRSVFPDLFLLNPCTRRCTKLPPVNGEMVEWRRMKHYFVYSAVDNDYKVICFSSKTGVLQVNIYSWRANSWITPVYIKAFVTFDCEQIFVAGKIYFGTRDSGLDADEPVSTLFDMASFDLETGVYGSIEQPDYGDGVVELVLEELGGCISVVCCKENHADLWVMKEYGDKKSWTKMLTVSFLDDPTKAFLYPVTILPSEEVLMGFCSSLEFYNLKDNSSRLLNTSKFGDFATAYLYVESLVSPKRERTRRQEDH